MSSQTELIPISGCENPNRIVDLIFVHGLGGDPLKTWHPQGKRDKNNFWPTWLGEDLPETAVWSLKYKAEPFRWRGSTMSLVDRATNVLDALDSYEIGKRPIVFITHSMGGLLVKQMLRRASDLRNLKWKAIVEQTKGIVFFSTPHSGSDVANFIKCLRILAHSVSVDELQVNASPLCDLNDWFRYDCQERNMKMLVYCEELPTFGRVVVGKTSANPGILGVDPISLDADHISICHLKSRENFVYKNVKNFVSDCLENRQENNQVAESNTSGHSNLLSTIKGQVTPKDIDILIAKNDPRIIINGNYTQNTKIINNNTVNKTYVINKTSKSLEFHSKILAALSFVLVGHIALFTGSLVFLTIAYVSNRMDGISSQSQDNVFLAVIEEQNFNDIFTAFPTESNNISINSSRMDSWEKLVILETNSLLIDNHNQIINDSLFPNYLMTYSFITTANSTFNFVTDNMGILMKNALNQGYIINDVSLILVNFPNRHLQKLGFRREELMVLDSFAEGSNSNKIFSAFPVRSNIPINPRIDNLGMLPEEKTREVLNSIKYMDKKLNPFIKYPSGVDSHENCCIPPDPNNTGQERKDGQENIDSIEPIKTKPVPEPSNVLALLIVAIITVIKKIRNI